LCRLLDAMNLPCSEIRALEATLLRDDLRDEDALGYARAAVRWFVQIAESKATEPWVATISPHLLEAARVCALPGNGVLALTAAAKSLSSALATWRNDLDDIGTHPMSFIGRTLKGDAGGHLEHRGPVFSATISDVLEGLAHEHVMEEWNYGDERSVRVLMTLGFTCVAAIAITAFWATQGSGSNLASELRRLVSIRHDRHGLRGQMANLVLAGNALAWGLKVSFVGEEKSEKTPDWCASLETKETEARVWVECTSVEPPPTFNDHAALREAIAAAWTEKTPKFTERRYQPGILTLDVSRIFLNRSFGTYLRRDLIRSISLRLRDRREHAFRVYDTTGDLELMAEESWHRNVLAVLASALHSHAATNNNIKGLGIYFGQVLWIDIRTGAVARPEGGLLAWRGSLHDEDLKVALALFSVRGNVRETPSVFLV
jgi:hypothetical protein